MFHPNHRPGGDFLNAVEEFFSIPGLPRHQVAAAANPETPTKTLAARPKPSRQALERNANHVLSAQEPKG